VPTRSERSNNLDFLRCGLAVLVIYSHSYALLSGSDATEPLYQWTEGQLSWGALAVDAFFIISGYLIAQSWAQGSGLGRFLLKRVLRIYPGFAAAVALGVLVVAPLSSDHTLLIDGWSWLLGTLNLRGYQPEGAFAGNPLPALNGSLWSIAYEFWCYIGIALLGVSGLLRRRRLVLGLLCATIAISLVFVVCRVTMGGKILGVIFGYPPLWARLLPYYLAGSTFYLWRDRIRWSAGLALGAVTLLIAGTLVPPWGVTLTFPIAFTYVLLFVAFRPVPILANWAKPGDFSYGVYLYAFPVQQLLVRWWPTLTPLTLFALATPVVFGCAFVSWEAIEKRFLTLKPAGSRQAAPPASVARQPLERGAGNVAIAVDMPHPTYAATAQSPAPSVGALVLLDATARQADRSED
jgi:peptidoglycan/LPS O-acetylase OafA/YrhL